MRRYFIMLLCCGSNWASCNHFGRHSRGHTFSFPFPLSEGRAPRTWGTCVRPQAPKRGPADSDKSLLVPPGCAVAALRGAGRSPGSNMHRRYNVWSILWVGGAPAAGGVPDAEVSYEDARQASRFQKAKAGEFKNQGSQRSLVRELLQTAKGEKATELCFGLCVARRNGLCRYAILRYCFEFPCYDAKMSTPFCLACVCPLIATFVVL